MTKIEAAEKKAEEKRLAAEKKAEEKAAKDAEADSEEDDEEGEGESEDEEVPEKLKSSSSPANDEVKKNAPEEDYLRMYQYKKVNNVPTIGGPATDPDAGSKAAIMKAFLLKQPKIFTMIPLPEGTDPKVPYSVTRNGYRLDLPTNTYIDLPVPIAEMIRTSNNQTIAALSRDRIEGNTKSGADQALNR